MSQRQIKGTVDQFERFRRPELGPRRAPHPADESVIASALSHIVELSDRPDKVGALFNDYLDTYEQTPISSPNRATRLPKVTNVNRIRTDLLEATRILVELGHFPHISLNVRKRDQNARIRERILDALGTAQQHQKSIETFEWLRGHFNGEAWYEDRIGHRLRPPRVSRPSMRS